MTTTLLLIDIQNDYFPGGSIELVGSPQAGARAGKLLHAFRQKSLPIIRKRSIDIAIDDGGSDDVEAKPNRLLKFDRVSTNWPIYALWVSCS